MTRVTTKSAITSFLFGAVVLGGLLPGIGVQSVHAAQLTQQSIDWCDAVGRDIASAHRTGTARLATKTNPETKDYAAAGALIRQRLIDMGHPKYAEYYYSDYLQLADTLAPALFTGYFHYQCLADAVDQAIPPLTTAYQGIANQCWNSMVPTAAEQSMSDGNRENAVRERVMYCVAGYFES